MTTIAPNAHVRLRYSAPRRGLVEFEVEAEQAVDTYVVDDEGLAAFYRGHEIPSYGGFTNRRQHRQEIRLPFRGPWYLLIVNRRPQAVAVAYEVWF